ncbi:NAD(P)H-dependent D-xylose reductase-like [Lingula anatina]|uniref:NAD(P)H-dependent D-xylose reductase-like n=1 Tax=Lingula anatina TaxID=7574 RepID=A0A1S3KGE2_LINAN|nr:NAD(P)H-dependent D-xylose reductase-like [Lingula anatina]|eukprot:XP_013421557.1 NAD(P)H-dependent D-xylose reductase-like [Lingula anatina]
MDATLSPEMTEDLTIPRFLGCDAIMKMMKQFALFFNAGWSSTYIHVDATETLFAQITGQRQWILIPPTHGKYLHTDDFNYHAGISPVEPDAVDLIKFPNISKVDIYNITLYEGDIIYVPEGWYHQVRTMGGPPNMAMAIFVNYLLCSEGGDTPDGAEAATTACIARREATPKEITCKERMEDMPMHEFIAQYSYINPDAIDVALEFESPDGKLRTYNSTLKSGFEMPLLGFGVRGQPTEKAKISTAHALRLQYSLFDTDPDDESEEILGTILASTPDVKREDVFIVVKVHPRNLGREKTIDSVKRSLTRLKTDYIDLVLIKAPSCDGMKFKCEADDNRGTWKESWESLEELIEGGKIRSLGVSNFKMSQLRKLIGFAKFPLSVVQSNFNLYNRKTKLRQFCKDNGIAFMAHGLMGVLETENGTRESPLLSHPKVDLAAKKYRTTPGTILIRWALSQNVTVTPPSTNLDHIAFNRHAIVLDIADSPWAIDMLTKNFPHVD